MSTLHADIEKTLLPGMSIPEPLAKLFEWIEENGLCNIENERRGGYLYPLEKLREGWTETERPGGTDIWFNPEGNVDLHHWFGHDRPEVLNRLCVFARTGADGSMAAFWIDDEGKQRIVHLGSGSGSTLVCVLADDPVDFLRLIAIGYDELCWSEKFSEPPNSDFDEGSPDSCFVHPNVEFQNWVTKTFSVDIPLTALEIVKHPSEMWDENSQDVFCRWVARNSG